MNFYRVSFHANILIISSSLATKKPCPCIQILIFTNEQKLDYLSLIYREIFARAKEISTVLRVFENVFHIKEFIKFLLVPSFICPH